MIHEIYPDNYNPDYIDKTIDNNDYALSYKGNGILVVKTDGEIRLPKLSDYNVLLGLNQNELSLGAYYLFEVSKEYFYLIDLPADIMEKIPYFGSEKELNIGEISEKVFYLRIHNYRELDPLKMVFAGATGYHIYSWKKANRFCGMCGNKMLPAKNERAMACECCNNMEFPKISPAVIVAIKNEDKLLLVRNKTGAYKKLALLSGYVEIGESFEQAVHREVYEEVGLKVKNIRFYKNQPWGISGAHMIGYVADLDGDDKLTLQESELSEAVWLTRDEIPEVRNRLSVGSEMICMYKEGKL